LRLQVEIGGGTPSIQEGSGSGDATYPRFIINYLNLETDHSSPFHASDLIAEGLFPRALLAPGKGWPSPSSFGLD
jgi:hypothetical protein